ncbi:MAG: tetratricopeptide repeat protein [Nitrospirae bacterium]|nr:MAG: tetratricopeptide repeat protein [Nitrospirota bacterium]
MSSKWSLFNKPFVHFFLIALLGFLIYSNTFNVPFHWDDTPNIVANYKLKDLSNFWPPSESRWFGYLTFALNYYFRGMNTTGYHAVNLAIHIFNAILVYWLVVLTFTFKTPYFLPPFNSPLAKGGYRGVALFSALLFVSHPIQTQAVTYIVQRFTSLATMFYLLSLVMYIKFRSQQSAISGQQKLYATRYTLYAVSLVSAILAMKTKEIAFTLPVVIALYEFMFFEGKIKRRILYLLPLLLTMFIIPLSLIGIDKPVGDAIGELREASQETEQMSRWSYLFTQFRVIITYIRLLVLPINQNLDYDYPIYHSFFNPEVFLSFLFLLSIFGLGVYLLHRSRLKLQSSPPLNPLLVKEGYGEVRIISFGIFWFFITLSVESSIIPIRDVIFEHRLYLPVIGIIIVFVSATFYILQAMTQNPKRSLAACCLLLATAVIVLSIAAYQRNIIWQDGVSLWEDVVKKSPNKARGHSNTGFLYDDNGLTDKAIEEYQIAIRLNPNYGDAHNNLAVAYYNKGLTDMAIEHYQIALRINPNYIEAYYNLGAAYKDKGMTDMAIEYYRIALRINPANADAHVNIANAYDDKGMTDKAIEHYQIALKLNQDNPSAHYNLGVAYERMGLPDEAIKQYQTALGLNPEHKIAGNSLNRIIQIQRGK